MNIKKRMIIIYSIFALLVGFDMLTKVLTDKIDVSIIDGVLSFSSVYNTGAAWSIFSDHTYILAFVSVAFVVLAVIFDLKTKIRKTKLYNFAYVFILAGAFGNAIDRVFLGYVRDFIKLDFINYPVFNVADSLLVVGVILLAIFIVFYKDDRTASSTTSNPTSSVATTPTTANTANNNNNDSNTINNTSEKPQTTANKDVKDN